MTDDEIPNIPEPEGGVPEDAFDKETLEKFIKGDITLAEMQGVDPESQEKLAGLGYNLLTSGKLEEAKQMFEGLIALNPQEPYFLLAAGSVAQRQERWDDAERWYSLCLERDEKNVAALANRGETRLVLERPVDAADDLMAAVKLDPDGEEPTTQRARALLMELKKQLEKIAN
jgi:tetratricopeptide (TPR) repeat protein